MHYLWASWDLFAVAKMKENLSILQTQWQNINCTFVPEEPGSGDSATRDQSENNPAT